MEKRYNNLRNRFNNRRWRVDERISSKKDTRFFTEFEFNDSVDVDFNVVAEEAINQFFQPLFNLGISEKRFIIFPAESLNRNEETFNIKFEFERESFKIQISVEELDQATGVLLIKLDKFEEPTENLIKLFSKADSDFENTFIDIE